MKSNKIRQGTKSLILLLGATISFSSCATIVSGGSPKITIDGNVSEPVTIVTEKQIYKDVTLPTQVKVNKHGIDGQHVHISSENHQFKDIVLEKKTNAWAFGNIMLGGIIGWCVDLATNAVSTPQQKHYYIEPK